MRDQRSWRAIVQEARAKNGPQATVWESLYYMYDVNMLREKRNTALSEKYYMSDVNMLREDKYK